MCVFMRVCVCVCVYVWVGGGVEVVRHPWKWDCNKVLICWISPGICAGWERLTNYTKSSFLLSALSPYSPKRSLQPQTREKCGYNGHLGAE